jgi:hypothetical protein
LKDRSNRVWNEISTRTYNYNKRKVLLSVLESVVYKDVVNFFNDKLMKNTAKISIHHYAGANNTYEEITNSKNIVEGFKFTNDIHATKGLSFIKPVILRKSVNTAKKLKGTPKQRIINSSILTKLRN